MSIQDLIQAINTQLPDNNKQLITEAILRGVLENMVNTLSTELRVFNINASDVTNNGDGTYTLASVENELMGALAFDEDLNIYQYNGTHWTLKTSGATAAQGAKADTAIQPGDNISGLNNDSGYLTETTHDALPQDNPHGVTKAQVGLGNVDNTSDANKPVSTAQQSAINQAEADAKQYTDDEINALNLGSASQADVGDFATAAQGTKADTAIQPGDNVSELTNNVGYVDADGKSEIYQGINILKEIPPRVNIGENTLTPAMFSEASEIIGRFEIDIIEDVDSPTSDIMNLKRVFTNTLTTDGSSCFRSTNLVLGAERPDIISIAFWTKRTQIENIYTGPFQVLLGSGNDIFNIIDVINGTPESYPITGTTDYTSAVMEVAKIYEVDDYVRIRITLEDIVWNPAFSGTSILYYYTFNFANSNGKSLDFIDFTVLFDMKAESDIVYPDPSGFFGSNTATISSLDERVTYIEQQNVAPENTIGVIFENNKELYISSAWDDTRNLVKQIDAITPNGFTKPPVVDFTQIYLSSKTGDQKTPVLSLKFTFDDTAPANVNGSFVGAGHGWNQPILLTKTGHGKTVADVGSIYQDANSVNFTILRIVDDDNLIICSGNSDIGVSYTFVPPSGDLVFVSDGANTATISGYTQSLVGNLFPSCDESTVTILLNGVTEIIDNGSYEAKYLDIRESYDVLDLPSIVAKITSARPTGGYIEQPLFNEIGADTLFTHSIVYRFLPNGTTVVYHSFRTHKPLKFTYHGFIQSQAIGAGSAKLYIPKTLPISDGSTVYDFRQITDWNVGPNNRLNLNSTYWENPLSPPDRFINMNNDIITHMGYITDRGVGVNRKDRVVDAIRLESSRKIYPIADSIVRDMTSNTMISCVAFRQFLNPANNPAGRTNYSWLDIDGVIWIYLDYHGQINDIIDPHPSWVGKKVSIIESNSKVEVLNDVVTEQINIVSTATATNYGYAVINLI